TIPALNDNVTVFGRNGGPFLIVFRKSMAGQSVTQLTSSVTGGTTATVGVSALGTTITNEVQRLSLNGNITGGTFTLTFGTLIATRAISVPVPYDPFVMANR